jgi:hypothetical protein
VVDVVALDAHVRRVGGLHSGTRVTVRRDPALELDRAGHGDPGARPPRELVVGDHNRLRGRVEDGRILDHLDAD